MKLNIQTLREIVSSIVKEEFDSRVTKAINEAVEKRMRSLAVSLIAESRNVAQKSAQQSVQSRQQPVTQQITKLLKKPASPAQPQNVMERVLLDTQQTTLREQQEAEIAQDQLPDQILEASSKYAKLAFASPLPARSSTVPKPDA